MSINTAWQKTSILSVRAAKLPGRWYIQVAEIMKDQSSMLRVKWAAEIFDVGYITQLYCSASSLDEFVLSANDFISLNKEDDNAI